MLLLHWLTSLNARFLRGSRRRLRPSKHHRRRRLQAAVPAIVEVLEDRTLLSSSPVAFVSGPSSINEGDGLALSALGSYDPDGMPLSYAWDLNNDGSFSDAFGESVSLAWLDLGSYGINGPGSYTAVVQASDWMDPPATASHTFSVQNVAPVISSAALDSTSVFPGQQVSFNTSFNDATPSASLAYSLNWGDGSAIETGTALSTHTASHSYSTAGSYTVTFSIDDGDGGVASWTGTVTVNAIVPSVSGPSTVSEGNVHTITLSANAPVEQWEINWGDGNTETLAGSTASAGHTYLDDNPTATSSDQYTIQATATYSGTQYAAAPLAVTVNNVAPTIDSASLSFASAFPGDNITLMASFSDPGFTADSFNYSINWGDGTTPDSGSPTGNSIDVSHAFTAAGTYTVALTVSDDDTGEVTWTGQVTVNDVIPTSSGPASTNEGSLHTITLGANAPATQWEINWGDGNTETLAGSTTSASHIYADDNPTATPSDQYTIQATATYNGTAYAAAPLAVTVNNVAPTITSASLDDNFTLTAAFSDPALMADSFNYSVNWGDDSDPATGTPTGNSVIVSHNYTAAGTYAVTLTIGDDDAGQAVWNGQVQIVADISGPTTVMEGAT